MNITSNTILITGGSSGIGRALAEAFHDRGNRVIITGRRKTLLDEITTSRPGITGIQLDLNDPKAVSHFAMDVNVRFPELNVLIANAGVSRSEDVTSDDWSVLDAEAIVNTNILGVLRATAAVLPTLKKQRNATIIATSSALAFVPRADFPTYCASKAFLHSWLQSMRHQLRHFPVEVIELAPPYVRTMLTGLGQASDPRALAVDEYIEQVMQKLADGAYPLGELMMERDYPRRWAERDGQYDTVFSTLNPT